MKLSEAVSRFLLAKKAEGISARLLWDYGRELGWFARSVRRLPARPEQVRAYMGQLSGASLTRLKYYAHLRAFLRWCALEYGLRDPTLKTRPPKVTAPPPQTFTRDEMGQVLGFPHHSPRDKALLWLLADSGMRIGEAFTIRKDSLRRNLVGDHYLEALGKTGWRRVVISPLTAGLLIDLPDADGVIWLGPRGPLTLSGLKQAVYRAMLAAGVKKRGVGAHTFRFTMATEWNDDILALKRQGGWSSMAMVAWYRQWNTEKAAEAHRKNSPVYKLLD